MGTKKTILPNEYQQAEYIESTGEQYINTLIVPSSYTGMKLEFSNLSRLSSSFNFCGCRTTDNRFVFGYGNGKTAYGYNGSYITDIAFPQEKATFSLNYFNDRYFVYKNYFFSLDRSLNEKLPEIYLFAQKSSASTPQKLSYKCYSFEITENEKLVLKFIPCYRKADGVIGMFDVVSRNFFVNSGTGTFLKGEDV